MLPLFFFFFFFNDTATTEIYTLSLHDALPIWIINSILTRLQKCKRGCETSYWMYSPRSEEHTSELQSQSNLVCRLLLEKKKKSTSTASALPHRQESPFHTSRYTSTEHMRPDCD